MDYNTDLFLGFTWNGVHSSVFETFITTDGEGLKFHNAPSVSNGFATPMFENKHYYTGTSYQRKSITLELAANGLTIAQYRKMLDWLKPGEVGFLQFDSDDYYGYKCVISNIGDGKKHFISGSTPKNYTYLIQFSVTFETVDNYAKSKYINILTAPNINGSIESGAAYNDEGKIELKLTTTIVSPTKTILIEFYNRGDVKNPFVLYCSGLKGDIKLVKEPSLENKTILFISPVLPSGVEIDLEYDSLSGVVYSAGKTIEQLVIQNNYVVSSKIAESGVFIEQIENDISEKFELTVDEGAEVIIAFDKKTFIV